MNKKKMLIATLAIALLVGIVSAALIPYFGQIKTTAEVDQAVLVDGKRYNELITDSITAVGGESICRHHYLTSQTSVPVDLQFSTSYYAGLRSTIVPYMEVTGFADIKDAFEPAHYKKYGYLYDADTGSEGWQTTTLSKIGSITYTYMVLADSSADNKPYVVLDLDTGKKDGVADTWVVEMVPPMAPSKGTWYKVTLTDTEGRFHIPGDTECTQSNPCTFARVKDKFGGAIVLKTSIAFGAFPGTETYKAYGGIIQVDTFPTQIDTITLQPKELLHFNICYSFDLLIEDGTYDIYTTIKPA